MSLFSQQLRNRIQKDETDFLESLDEAAETAIGKRSYDMTRDDPDGRLFAVSMILRYYGMDDHFIVDSGKSAKDRADCLLRDSGVMYRQVSLKKGWSKSVRNPMLAKDLKTGKYCALIPGFRKYRQVMQVDGEKKQRVVSAARERSFEERAFVMFRPLPARKLTKFDLFKFLIRESGVGPWLVLYMCIRLIVYLNGLLPGEYASMFLETSLFSNQISIMFMGIEIAIIMFCIVLIDAIRKFLCGILSSRLSLALQMAFSGRMLNLPVSYFGGRSGVETGVRILSIPGLCDAIINVLFVSTISASLSVEILTPLYPAMPTIVMTASSFCLAAFLTTVVISILAVKYMETRMKISMDEYDLVYGIMCGIKEVKLTGSEKRMFSRWANKFNSKVALNYHPPGYIRVCSVLSKMILLVGGMMIYYLSHIRGIGMPNFVAINIGYGLAGAAIMEFSGNTMKLAAILSSFKLLRPIMDEVPETFKSDSAQYIKNGSVGINEVCFAYEGRQRLIFDKLSLKIAAGEYVAIVGKTGCGKSTLIRLLLGFEKPLSGTVSYDGRSLESYDINYVRQSIGCVLQDGSLFPGDIYSNIALGDPNISMADAWEVAEQAGIAEDIDSMPMGMFTIVSEGSGNISGGQKQRILIARALAGKPSILIFDEATSALDNVTQKKVTDSLNSIKCTRIVIAHRLSTVRHCDRIIVLDEGRIIEEGSYDELMKKDGAFAALAKRQLM